MNPETMLVSVHSFVINRADVYSEVRDIRTYFVKIKVENILLKIQLCKCIILVVLVSRTSRKYQLEWLRL